MTQFFCLHTALCMISLHSRNCSSSLCNKTTGRLVGRNCMLLCKLTVCSSLMTVFLWMWLTGILVIWNQNLWQDVSNMEHLPLSWKIHLFKCQFKIPYFMERYIFISKVTRGINCALAYTVTSIVWTEKISSPTAVIMKVKSTCLKYGGKYKLHKLVIISMIRLPWHIQMFRRILISAMKYYLE